LDYDSEPYWSRHHVVLESNPACTFTCGEEGEEEMVHMEAGSAWWFNSALMHSCANKGTTDRIHLIIDVHCGHMGA
jgi:ectoine hydroxylase-related dioxygenase (phytanoyl-CoA dioxygenase family)